MPRRAGAAAEEATDELDTVDGEAADIVLVERVHVRPVVRSRRFSKHPNDNSEEACDFRHGWSVAAEDSTLQSFIPSM
jgi:hypothetical protein